MARRAQGVSPLDETVARNLESVSMVTDFVLRQSDCQSLIVAYMAQRLAHPEELNLSHLSRGASCERSDRQLAGIRQSQDHGVQRAVPCRETNVLCRERFRIAFTEPAGVNLRGSFSVDSPGTRAENRLAVDLHPGRQRFEYPDLVGVDSAVAAHRHAQ